jgi:Helix-turn-helix domain
MRVLNCELKEIEKADSLPPPSRWLRIPQAVKYSGISRAFLYRLLTSGAVKSISINTAGKRGVRLVDQKDLDTFMESQKREGWK